MNGLNLIIYSERNQIAAIDGITSSSFSMCHAVPQSLSLVRYFSIIYYDLPNSSSLFKFIIFVDCRTLSTSFADENALKFTLTLSHELN